MLVSSLLYYHSFGENGPLREQVLLTESLFSRNKCVVLLIIKFSLQTVGHGQRLVEKIIYIQIEANSNECLCVQ